LPPLEQIKKPF